MTVRFNHGHLDLGWNPIDIRILWPDELPRDPESVEEIYETYCGNHRVLRRRDQSCWEAYFFEVLGPSREVWTFAGKGPNRHLAQKRAEQARERWLRPAKPKHNVLPGGHIVWDRAGAHKVLKKGKK